MNFWTWFRGLFRKRGGVAYTLPTDILQAKDEGRYKVFIVMPVPEMMTGVLGTVEDILRPELGEDYTRRISETLKAHNWGRCTGGWLPLGKAINMIHISHCFPHNDVLVGYICEGISGPNTADQREHGVELALENGADWIWLQDWDVEIPDTAFGVLKSRNVDIVSGTYFYKSRTGPRTMAMIPPQHVHFDAWWQKIGQEYAPGEKFSPGKLYPGLAVVPNGCLLVKADVFRHVPRPWFTQGNAILEGGQGHSWTDDGWFSHNAIQAGYTLHLDTRVQCDHWDYTQGIGYGFDLKHMEPAWHWLTDPKDRWRSFRGEVASLGYIERSQDAPSGEAGGDNCGALDGRIAEPDSERVGAAGGA